MMSVSLSCSLAICRAALNKKKKQLEKAAAASVVCQAVRQRFKIEKNITDTTGKVCVVTSCPQKMPQANGIKTSEKRVWGRVRRGEDGGDKEGGKHEGQGGRREEPEGE